MAPRNVSGKDKLDDEDILQAVIIADSFNDRFKPLTLQRPRCLIPLCNAPLLDWTFESLAIAGVEKVYVMSRAHTKHIQEAIRESKWARPSSGLQIVHLPLATSVSSFGDAMRQLDGHQIITSDFVLVTGDLVSNIRIDEVIRQHKERRKLSKEVIMTMVVKEAGPGHRTRPAGDTSLFVLDAESSECLHYEPVIGLPQKKHAQIPREIFRLHREIAIRNDLIDCGIDVCSVDVPLLFTENFDYEDMRRDFVHGVLTSDLLDKTMFCYIATDGYATRVRDTKTYAAVTKDIISRWTFPLVPDDNHPGGQDYGHARGNRYIAKSGVSLARTCKIGHNTLIASGVRIQDNVSISFSTVGSGAVLGAGSIIRNSYIWENVEIGRGCVIDESIIAANARILEGSIIRKGCLIGEGVTVGPHASLEAMLRLAKWTPKAEGESESESDSDEEEEDGQPKKKQQTEETEETKTRLGLGSEFDGYVYTKDDIIRPKSDDSDDSDVEANVELPPNINLLRLGDETYLSDASSSSSSGLDTDSGDDDDHSSDFDGFDSDTSISSSPSGMRAAEFEREARATLDRCVEEGISVDDTALELKTLRMSSNADQERVKILVLEFVIQLIEKEDTLTRAALEGLLDKYGMLIPRVGGQGIGILSHLQTVCATPETRHRLFQPLVFWMYQEDMVEEEHIHAWHNLPATKDDTPGFMDLWEIGNKVIEKLEEASEDDSDESDEGESGSGDSEDGSEEEPQASPSNSAALPPSTASSNPPDSAEGAGASHDSDEGSDDSDDGDSDEEEEGAATTATVPSDKTSKTTAAHDVEGADPDSDESDGSDDLDTSQHSEHSKHTSILPEVITAPHSDTPQPAEQPGGSGDGQTKVVAEPTSNDKGLNQTTTSH